MQKGQLHEAVNLREAAPFPSINSLYTTESPL